MPAGVEQDVANGAGAGLATVKALEMQYIASSDFAATRVHHQQRVDRPTSDIEKEQHEYYTLSFNAADERGGCRPLVKQS